jgi:hypothetical protein
MWSIKYDHDNSENPKVIKVGDHWIQPDFQNRLVSMLLNFFAINAPEK